MATAPGRYPGNQTAAPAYGVQEMKLNYINKKTQQFCEGRIFWHEYIRLNGYANAPNKTGLRKLSRLLDLKQSYFEPQIWVFLTN